METPGSPVELGEERVGGEVQGCGGDREGLGRHKAQTQGVELVPVLSAGFCSVEMEEKLFGDPKAQKYKRPENVCQLVWGECRMVLIEYQLHQRGWQKEPKQTKRCGHARA